MFHNKHSSLCTIQYILHSAAQNMNVSYPGALQEFENISSVIRNNTGIG